MSNANIALALETALIAVSTGIQTAWENALFNVPPTAYQVVTIMFAEPENPTMGSPFFRQRGYLNVSIRYPLGVGKQPAVTRAEAMRTAFARGTSFMANGITTVIEKTPAIGTGSADETHFNVNFKAYFYANIGA